MINYKIIIILIILLFIIQIYYLNKTYNYKYYIPKYIFTYWDKSTLDPFIEIHIQIWKEKLPAWEIHIITSDNIDLYVDKKYYKQYEHLLPQHFSNHLRLYLLEKFGGLWMDGSILIIKPNFIEELYINMKKNNSQLGLFEYNQKTIDKKSPYLENWFIMAPFNSNAIKLWKIEFDKCNINNNNCRNKIIESNTNIESTIKNSDYLMQHAILNMLCKNKTININKINILQATDSMFYLQEISDWDTKKFGDIILNHNLNSYDNIYAIKYTGKFRHYFDNKLDQYKKSILKIKS